MKSVLEYSLTKLIGTAASGGKWKCPCCKTDPPTLHLRECPDRWRFGCTACDNRGDLADFIKLRFPNEDWSQRQSRITKLERDARRDRAFFSGNGEGDSGGEFEAAVKAAADLSADHFKGCSECEIEKALVFASEVLWLAGSNGIDPRHLSERIAMMCFLNRAFG